MNLDRDAIIAAIKAEIVRIAATMDTDASDLTSDELIPASGFIDSAGLLDLVAWYEAAYDFRVPAADFTVDNLGTIEAMADFVLKRKGVR
jgi:acyl carrier protein